MIPDDAPHPVVEWLDDPPIGDWLDDAWQSLPDRWDIIVSRRLAGETLDRIAETFDLTRERIPGLRRLTEPRTLR